MPARHKQFDKIFPYTYLITHIPTKKMYHGGRARAFKKGVTPNQDLGITYFGSSTHELFDEKQIRQNFNDYRLEVRWTFDSDVDMWDHEYLVNRRILVRKAKVECGIVNAAAWCNKTGTRMIEMTPEVIEKAVAARNKVCTCHDIPECDGTLIIADCNKIKSARTATERLCSCYRIPECDGRITIAKCRSYVATTSKHELCACGECSGQITIQKCSAIKLAATMSELCSCGECDGTVTRRTCINRKSSTKTEIYTFINHENESESFTGTQSAFAEFVDADTGEVGLLISSDDKQHVRGWYIEGKKPKSFKIDRQLKTLYHPHHEPITGTMPELASYIAKLNDSDTVYDISPIFRPGNKKMTHFGWYCKEKNPDAVGGRNLAAKKNKYWQFKKQTKESLRCWKHVKEIKQCWDELGQCSYTKLLRNLPDGLISTKKRCLNLVKLFQNESEYFEMIELHKQCDFDSLIAEAKAEDFSNSLIPRELDSEICQNYLDGRGTPELSKEYGVGIDVIISVLDRNSVRIRPASECNTGKPNLKLRALSEAQEKEVLVVYAKGKSQKQLAKDYDVSDTVIAGVLKRNSVKARDASEARGGVSKKLDKEICQKYLNGKSPNQLADEYDTSRKAIQNVLRRNDVALRDKSAGQSKGTWYTPNGAFSTAKAAGEANGIRKSSAMRKCKNPEAVAKQGEHRGKTNREQGWWFEAK